MGHSVQCSKSMLRTIYMQGLTQLSLQQNKISNTYLFLFSNKMLVIKAGIYKCLVRVADREDPDQTASSEAV